MKSILVLIAVALTLTGCGANAEPANTTDSTPALPADHPQITGAETTAAADSNTLSGNVEETMNGGGYTYIRIAGEQGDTWVAIPLTEVKVGDDVTVSVQMTMTNFESTALNRTFESLVFATMGGAPASAHGGTGMGMGMGMGHGATEQANIEDVNVEKATGENAKTVAELWAQRGELKDSTVIVRGKVVKFLPSIMGRNWVHLRDGSGNAEKADNDITITTDATVNVGDVVVATGVVRIDKDLGAGYSYPVILEEATFAN